MRVADYITDALYRAGGEHVFGVTGGMIVHLTDALLQHPKQEFVACHHEAAAVMAADGAGRLTGRIGVAYVTAGPGALNAIPAAAGAFVDGAPVVIVAGQSKVEQLVNGPRQFALQGFNTLPLAERVTKYAALVTDPKRVRYHVERAIWEATYGHRGPVWLEVPVDVQGMEFDPTQLGFDHVAAEMADDILHQRALDKMVDEVVELIAHAKRPVILAGAGVQAAGAAKFLNDIGACGIPVLTSRLGMDLVPDNAPYFAGRPGTYGERAANFTCQNADLMIVIGCRLAIGLVGYDFKGWAPRAKKVVVDLDPQELAKPSVWPDLAILADAGAFLLRLKWRLQTVKPTPEVEEQHTKWLETIQHWRANYPVDLPEYAAGKNGEYNSYHFTRLMSDYAKRDDILVVDTGSCFHVHAQAWKVKAGQRHIITGGLSTMGFMPAAVGAAKAAPGQSIWCITGDGSLQMNLQELATIAYHQLPVKIIVHDNDGYLLIRNTQKNLMSDRRIGESPETGVGFPDLKRVAGAYGVKHIDCWHGIESVKGILEEVRRTPGPVICQVRMRSEQALQPRVGSYKLPDGSIVSGAYDDMVPPLSRDEYEASQIWRLP